MSEIKLKAGQIWILNDTDVEREILFVGKERVFFKDKDGEASQGIAYFLEYHTLKPEEPKPIGRLYYNKLNKVISFCLTNRPKPSYCKPITINEKGEVFLCE